MHSKTGGKHRTGYQQYLGFLVIHRLITMQHCCNDDHQSQWENGDFEFLPPIDLKPLKIVLQKLDILITLQGPHTGRIYGNRHSGVHPTNSCNITSCDFVYLPFPSLFSCRRPQQTAAGRVDVSYRSIHQTTRFQPRMCILG